MCMHVIDVGSFQVQGMLYDELNTPDYPRPVGS